jgi:alpha-ketoglutarate-dependent 2,4-dichlorophenoxyacetate dioxygenase
MQFRHPGRDMRGLAHRAQSRKICANIKTLGGNAMLSIRPLHPIIGGEVSGVDLTKPMTREEVAAIEAGMDKYAVLVFPGQNITDDQQMAFTLNFGQIENQHGGHIAKAHEQRLKQGMVDVSNLDQTGKPLERNDRRRMFNLGNRLWHSDSSFRAIPAKYSLLSARKVASEGGNTEFADMRNAYDTLDEKTRALVEDMVCEHSQLYSRGSMGFSGWTEEEIELFKPVRQCMVRTHPVTGRKSLYLSSHAGHIIGWQVPESRDLLRDLNEHATQRENVYIHRWKLHDLVMWDNRQTMHRVRRFDETQPRDMRRTTVAGDGITVAQAEAA